MSESTATPSRIDKVDWSAIFPATRLFGALRLALQPGKVTLALALVLALYLGGVLMDLLWGTSVINDDAGVFETLILRQKADVAGLFDAALAMNVAGMVASIRHLAIDTPRWLLSDHPWFAVVFSIYKIFVFALLGGAICRMAATQACVGKTTSMLQALRYSASHLVSFILAPLLPAVLIAILAGMLLLAGLVFFNLPVLDVVGALLFGFFLLLGLFIAILSLGLMLGSSLMFPALAVEGTDAFDAISRAYNYVFFRPWQFAFYTLTSVFVAAVVYVAISSIASGTIAATWMTVDQGSFATVDDAPVEDATRFKALWAHAMTYRSPDAPGGESAGDPQGTLSPAAWIIARWVDAVYAIVAAIMLSLMLCLQTWVYLLLRRSADGTPFYDCNADEASDADPSAEQSDA